MIPGWKVRIGYFDIDRVVVWGTLTTDLPALERAIRNHQTDKQHDDPA